MIKSDEGEECPAEMYDTIVIVSVRIVRPNGQGFFRALLWEWQDTISQYFELDHFQI